MRQEPFTIEEQSRVLHTVLGSLLLVYSGLGLASNEFFAEVSRSSRPVELLDPVVWLMTAAMICGVSVLAALSAGANGETRGRSRLRKEYMLLFQGMGWCLFLFAAMLYVHSHVLS